MGIVCATLGHGRDHDVWHDSVHYRSTCRRCGTALVRDAAAHRWRAFDPSRDARPGVRSERDLLAGSHRQPG